VSPFSGMLDGMKIGKGIRHDSTAEMQQVDGMPQVLPVGSLGALGLMAPPGSRGARSSVCQSLMVVGRIIGCQATGQIIPPMTYTNGRSH
jgi:hypothetical protein